MYFDTREKIADYLPLAWGRPWSWAACETVAQAVRDGKSREEILEMPETQEDVETWVWLGYWLKCCQE